MRGKGFVSGPDAARPGREKLHPVLCCDCFKTRPLRGSLAAGITRAGELRPVSNHDRAQLRLLAIQGDSLAGVQIEGGGNLEIEQE